MAVTVTARWGPLERSLLILVGEVAVFGVASAEDRVLCSLSHGAQRGYQHYVYTGQEFGDFVLEASLRRSPAVTHFGLVFRCRDQNNLYRVVLRNTQADFRVEKVLGGNSDYAATPHIPFPNNANRWYQVKVEALGDRVRLWIDGKPLYDRGGFGELRSGHVGVTVFDYAVAEFDDFKVSSSDGRTLYQNTFDAGDPTDWVVVADAGVGGKWGTIVKAEKQEPRQDFTDHNVYRLAEAEVPVCILRDFPCIARLRNGDLMSVWIDENQHGTPPWAAMPKCGRFMALRSTDDGKNWSAPEVFLDTPIDDRHAYLTQLSDGALLCVFHVQFTSLGVAGCLTYAMRSEDNGHTWGDPRRFEMPFDIPYKGPRTIVKRGVSFTAAPVELGDGTLVLSVQTLATSGHNAQVGLLRSKEGGWTWGDYTPIFEDPKASFNVYETRAIRLQTGRWLAAMRVEKPFDANDPEAGYTLGPTLFSTSEDGRHWTPAVEMPLDFTKAGSTATYLWQTRSGVVVFAVNTGVAFSYDEGRSWRTQTLNLGYYPVLWEIAPDRMMSLACGMEAHVFSPLPKPSEQEPQPPVPPKMIGDKETPVVTPAGEVQGELPKPSSSIRVVRFRGKVECGGADLAATFASKERVLALRSSNRGATWSVEVVATIAGAENVVPAELPDRTLVCLFSIPGRGVALCRSKDGGTWSRPAFIPETKELRCSSPLAVAGDGKWLLPATDKGNGAVLLQSNDKGATWRSLSIASGHTEPSLTVRRDGKWHVLLRRANDDAIVETLSTDGGKSWSEVRPIGLKGRQPQVVELLEGLLLASALGTNGQLLAAYTWIGAEAWYQHPLAVGYAIRSGEDCYLAQGVGRGLNGEINHLEQVPLSEIEQSRWLERKLSRRQPGDQGWKTTGEWKDLTTDESRSVVSAESQARVDVTFEGTGIGLVLPGLEGCDPWRVVVDGVEYPPVHGGSTPLRRCITDRLGPGQHTLSLTRLLPWRKGKVAIEAVEVVGG